MQRQFLRSALILFTVAAITNSAEAGPIISNIGVLAGESNSEPFAVSGDGSTVTGYSGHYNSQQQLRYDRAMRWTAAGGMQDIGTLSVGNTRAAGFAINADGTAIAATSLSNNGSVNARAFRWTKSGGIQALGLLPGGSYSDARGISANGSVVVGYAGDSSSNDRAFRWTDSGGMQSLGVLAGMTRSNALGVSHDGSVVVGASFTDLTSRAFRWTSSGGMTSLGVLPGGESSGATAVSGNGLVIIGSAYSSTSGGSAFRWTSAGGMQDLGTVPGPDYGEFYAAAINGNGSEIVGSVDVFHNADFSHGAIWTSSLGVVDLNTYLPSVGVDVTGWKLTLAYGISDDGSTISGIGTLQGQPAAWIVTGLPVPEPGAVGLVALFASGALARRRRPIRSKSAGRQASRMRCVTFASAVAGPMPLQTRSTSSSRFLQHHAAAGMALTFRLNPSGLLVGLLFLLTAGSALAQPFTYTYFPSNATINVPVTTDLAIVGYAGGIYNDDLTRNFTGPSSPTVTIAAGADIADAEVFNHSIVNVTGGSVGAVVYDNSTMNIAGGTVGFALSFDSAEVNVTGGTVSSLEGQGRRLSVKGGTFDFLDANSNTDPTGTTLGSCIAEVTGGTFTNEVNATNDGILNLRGGQFLGASLRAVEGGTLNIYGSNLSAQLIDPNALHGYSLYDLSGLLSDGSPLDGVELRVRNDGVTYGHSTFNLIDVPEPAPLDALGLAGLLAACRRGRRKQQDAAH